MPKFLVFDGERVAYALRMRFPLMEEVKLREIVTTAGQIVDHLWHGREARIAAHGEAWRPLDSFAEVVAFAFNLESMTQDSAGSGTTVNLIFEAVRSAYVQTQDPGAPPPPPTAMPPSGRN
jgi:hypothetical protein